MTYADEEKNNGFSSDKILNYFLFCAFGLCTILYLPAIVTAEPGTNPPINFEDPVIDSTKPIRAIHIQEMRAAINAKRVAAGLHAFTFTDPIITAGVTRIRAVHFMELEKAIQGYYENNYAIYPHWKNWFVSTYETALYEMNPSIRTLVDATNVTYPGPVNRPIKGSHVKDLRSAIQQAGFCGDTICQAAPSGPEACGTCDVDCNTPCTSSAFACGSPTVACGTAGNCTNLQRCVTTTCFCGPTYACVADAACSSPGCSALTVNTGTCGSATIPATGSGNVGSVACPSGCTGTVSATCTNGTFGATSGTCAPNSCAAADQTTPCRTATLPPTVSGGVGSVNCPSGCTGGPLIATCTNGIFGVTSGTCTVSGATCSDGIQNQGETGVDCGGPCATCLPCATTTINYCQLALSVHGTVYSGSCTGSGACSYTCNNSSWSLNSNTCVITWTPRDSDRGWNSVSVSATGQYQTTTIFTGQIYISSDYGSTWTAKGPNMAWSSVSISSTGQYQTATVYTGQIYISSDYGNTWTAKDSNRFWESVSISSTGQYQTAVGNTEQIYVSSDYGNTWAAKGGGTCVGKAFQSPQQASTRRR